MINDTCDYCRREFARPGLNFKPICPSCGLTNVREAKPLSVRETAVTATPERAVIPQPLPRKKFERRKKRV